MTQTHNEVVTTKSNEAVTTDIHGEFSSSIKSNYIMQAIVQIRTQGESVEDLLASFDSNSSPFDMTTDDKEITKLEELYNNDIKIFELGGYFLIPAEKSNFGDSYIAITPTELIGMPSHLGKDISRIMESKEMHYLINEHQIFGVISTYKYESRTDDIENDIKKGDMMDGYTVTLKSKDQITRIMK